MGDTDEGPLRMRRALQAIRQAETRIARLEAERSAPIAVLGLACRFPGGAENPERFWDNLIDGVDAITEVPASRWDLAALYADDPATPGTMSSRWGGFLERVDLFDGAFFGITPREAASMDPQQRLALELAWEALEDAAVAPDRLAGSRTGVFVGACNVDYAYLLGRERGRIDGYLPTGTALSMLANRISYVLGLQGPSLTVDTSCSSALVALHLAVQSLRAGDCDLALVGGVNVILAPELTVAFSKARVLARDGRCKSFDARADGYVRSEGGGFLVLERELEARNQRHRIRALVRGTAVTQSGATSGLTAPNGRWIQAAIERALASAQIEAGRIGFVESQGTGTPVGDAIELEALARTVGRSRADGAPCFVGAVKTNLGHLEGASGAAALIKTVLVLERRRIPPNLHFDRLAPEVKITGSRLRIPGTPVAWDGPTSRWAGVNAYGFGGTNAHVILEAAPESSQRPAAGGALMFPLSARTVPALSRLAAGWARHLERHPELELRDVCFTAGAGRAHFDQRLAVVAAANAELIAELDAFAGDPAGERLRGRPAEPAASMARRYLEGATIDWSTVGAGLDPRPVAGPTYAFERERCWIEMTGAAPEPAQPIRELLVAAPPEDRVELLSDWLTAEAAAVLRCRPERIDRHRPLTRQGLDSLAALELRGRLEAALATTIAPAQFIERPEIYALAGALLDRMTESAAAAHAAAVDQLSDAQVEELLRRLLTSTPK